jgi:hypothetical protein
MCIIEKYKNWFALAAKQERKAPQRFACLPVSKARTIKFYIFQQCTCIVYDI